MGSKELLETRSRRMRMRRTGKTRSSVHLYQIVPTIVRANGLTVRTTNSLSSPPSHYGSRWRQYLAAFLADRFSSLPRCPLVHVNLFVQQGASLRGSGFLCWLLEHVPLYQGDYCQSLSPIVLSLHPFCCVVHTMPLSISIQQGYQGYRVIKVTPSPEFTLLVCCSVSHQGGKEDRRARQPWSYTWQCILTGKLDSYALGIITIG